MKVSTNPPEIVISEDKKSLNKHALTLLLGVAQDAINDHGNFSIALAGGSTPKGLYELIADLPDDQLLNISKWRFFFGDERLVPSDDKDSNFQMANITLFKKLIARGLISPDQIHRFPTELSDAQSIVASYSNDICKSFRISENQIPQFDLILLGLGSDGHIASLFPGKPTLTSKSIITDSEPCTLLPAIHRITLSLSTINTAKHIYFLVSGEDKSSAVKAALTGEPLIGQEKVPAALINPQQSTWFIDEAAASKIK